jgi:flagellar protein FliJ
MKRFNWKLQRLLDVKIRQEELKKAQLFALIQKIAEIRQNLLVRQAKLRQILIEFAEKPADERLRQQQLILNAISVTDEQIEALKKQLAEVEAQKKALMAEVLEIRKFRKSLERLREIAVEEYKVETRKSEQNHLDEVAGIAFARTMLEIPVHQ